MTRSAQKKSGDVGTCNREEKVPIERGLNAQLAREKGKFRGKRRKSSFCPTSMELRLELDRETSEEKKNYKEGKGVVRKKAQSH